MANLVSGSESGVQKVPVISQRFQVWPTTLPTKMISPLHGGRRSPRFARDVSVGAGAHPGLILRHLQPAPATGAGCRGRSRGLRLLAGLARLPGHLIDPVPNHVEQALAASAKLSQHPLASATLEMPGSCSIPARSAEAVLFVGPFITLSERDERLAALREAHRVSEVVVGVQPAISRFASLLDSLSTHLR